MNHPLFRDLRYDPGNEFWTGAVSLRHFAAFGEADDEEALARRREGALPLTVYDPTGEGPSRQQEKAFAFLLEHETEVFQTVLGALFDCYKSYTSSFLSGFWGRIGRWFGIEPIESPEGLAAEVGFMSVEVMREHRRGCAYVLFNVDCGWEPEHGMMIVYHKELPATCTTVDALEVESDGI